MFNSTVHNLLQNKPCELLQLYEAVAVLSGLGSDVTRDFILPPLKFISWIIEPYLQHHENDTDKITATIAEIMCLLYC